MAGAERGVVQETAATHDMRRLGLYIATPPISVLVCVLIILIALSKRVSTYRRALLSSSTPVGAAAEQDLVGGVG